MSKPAIHQTLDIQGTVNSYRVVAFVKLGLAVLLGGLAIILWFAKGGNFEFSAKDFEEFPSFPFVASVAFSFIFAASLAFSKQTYVYLDFTDRQTATVEHYAWVETSKRRRSLTDFSRIVVRHLCHPSGEGPDTYSGSVGLKPVDGKAVLWVKNFPATEDEVPRTTYEFARKLQEMAGLPVAATAEFKNETHGN